MRLVREGFELRTWKKDDEERLFQLLSDPIIIQNMGDSYSELCNKKNISDYIQEFSDPRSNNLAITIDDEVIGGIEIIFGVKSYVGLVEYWLGKDYRGKGIASKALKTFTEYNFKERRIERIEGRIYTWNNASVKTAENAGYKYEGTLRKDSMKNNMPVDIMIYSCIREDLTK